MATTPPSRKRAAPKKAPSTSKTKPAAPSKGKTAGSAAPRKAQAPKPAPKAKQVVPGDKEGTNIVVSEDISHALQDLADQPLQESQLNPRQLRFVDEYLIDLNGTQAAIRAGYSARTANEQAAQLLAKLSVQRAVTAARKAQQERTQISADKVVLGLWNIFSADPRDIVQVQVGCCRHCWGEGHRRQRTLSEYNHDREKFREGGKPAEDWEEEGGIGYTPLRDPHPSCPECHGDGCPRVVLGDTRRMSQGTAALYAGAKNGKHGIEVQMHSKLDAAEKLMKHLGAYEKDNNQKGDPLAALLQSIAGGNSNGFRPMAADPERPEHAVKPSTFTPKAEDGERDWQG